MKIRLSELRQIVREEIAKIVEGPQEDQESYEKIMAMITSTLGDSPETKKLGSDLQTALQSKKQATVPGTISMKSVAQPQQTTPTTPTAPATQPQVGAQSQQQPQKTFTMKSLANKPGATR